MAEQEKKGRRKHRAVRDVFFSPYLSLVSRLVLGGVFLYAGASKVFDPGGLAASIRSYGLGLPEWFITLSANALPPLRGTAGALPAGGSLHQGFSLDHERDDGPVYRGPGSGGLRGLEIDCGCFGSASGDEAQNLWINLARDLGLLALGLQLAFAPSGKFSLDARLRRNKT